MSPQPDPISTGMDPTLTRVAGALQSQPVPQRPTPTGGAASARTALPDRFTSTAHESAQRSHDALLAAIRTFADRHQARTAAQRAAEAKIPRPPIAGSYSAAEASISPVSVKMAVAVQTSSIAEQEAPPLDGPAATPLPQLPTSDPTGKDSVDNSH
jgi:hypothetical protein